MNGADPSSYSGLPLPPHDPHAASFVSLFHASPHHQLNVPTTHAHVLPQTSHESLTAALATKIVFPQPQQIVPNPPLLHLPVADESPTPEYTRARNRTPKLPQDQKIKRTSWTENEVEQLKILVAENRDDRGFISWIKVAERFGTRSGKSSQRRWQRLMAQEQNNRSPSDLIDNDYSTPSPPQQNSFSTVETEPHLRTSSSRTHRKKSKMEAPDRAIQEVIEEVGRTLNRPKEEIDKFIELLTQNWISHLSQWRALPSDKRRLFGLPIMLEHELDRIAAEGQPSNHTNKRQRAKGKDKADNNQSKRARTATESVATSQESEALINASYSTPEFIVSTKQLYHSRQASPYSYCFLHEFLNDPFLQQVRDELLHLEYVHKSNDLYDFWQTAADLKAIETPAVSKLKAVLYGQEFRNWLTTITGIEGLNDEVDMSAARYVDGSTLLCHDDELEGRRIAYILYLVPKDWNGQKDGGTLDLFGVGADMQPYQIVESFAPVWNGFMFFEVNPVSFHQVSEVIASDKERLSISGWFHGPPIVRNPPAEEPPAIPTPPMAYMSLSPIAAITIAAGLPSSAKPDDEVPSGEAGALMTLPEADWVWLAGVFGEDTARILRAWINPLYLQEANMDSIRTSFIEESSIELPEFLRPDRFDDIMGAIDEQPWQYTGPVNRRHYQRLLPESAEGAIRDCRSLLVSSEFSQYLRYATKLDIISSSDQMRCFRPGTYTLAHDSAIEEQALDAVFCCATNNIDVASGGQLLYMDEDTELFSVQARPNSLALTYRDPGTMRFIKYLNHHCSDIRYDFAVVWYEDPTAVHEQEEDTGDEEEEED